MERTIGLARVRTAVALATFASAFVLVWLVFGTSSAQASRFDCDFASCGFGTEILSHSTSLSTSSWTGSLDAHVFDSGSGKFSYMYSFTLTSDSSVSLWGLGIVPNGFDFDLGFGLVTDWTTSLSDVEFYDGIVKVVFPMDMTILAMLDPGDTLTFYSRSLFEPTWGTFGGIGTDFQSGTSETLAAIPEPSSLLLLGLGIPILGRFVRRSS